MRHRGLSGPHWEQFVRFAMAECDGSCALALAPNVRLGDADPALAELPWPAARLNFEATRGSMVVKNHRTAAISCGPVILGSRDKSGFRRFVFLSSIPIESVGRHYVLISVPRRGLLKKRKCRLTVHV